jgi:hypothetical protein
MYIMYSMLIDPTKFRNNTLVGGRLKKIGIPKSAKKIIKGNQPEINSKLSKIGKTLQSLEKRRPKDKLSNITF